MESWVIDVVSGRDHHPVCQGVCEGREEGQGKDPRPGGRGEDQIGPNRPGAKGFVGQPLPVAGLYLGSAGCHGGPGITFIPGYNAAHQVLADR